MSLPQKSPAYIELVDYLALENASANRHEYLDGVIYSVQGEPARGMAGGTQRHANIVRNVGFALHTKLRGTPCNTTMSDMRLRIDEANAVFYPDVLVNCHPVPPDTLELRTATLVAEVLSPTTQHFDFGAKLAAYQKLPGLRQVLLVSSMENRVWVTSRPDDNPAWCDLREIQASEPAIALDALGIKLGIREIFEGA